MPCDVNPHIDDAVWNETRCQKIGVQLSLPFNEFGSCIQVRGEATNSLVSYEKAGLMVQAVQRDPSIARVQRDMVGVDSRGMIASGNMMGRAWGGADWAGMESNADGLLVGREVGVDNDGVDQPALDQTNSKYAFLLVPGYEPNNKPVTAAIYPTPGTSQFHRILVTRRSTISQHPDASFLDLKDEQGGSLFKVSRNGDLVVAGRSVGVKPVTAQDGSTILALYLI